MPDQYVVRVGFEDLHVVEMDGAAHGVVDKDSVAAGFVRAFVVGEEFDGGKLVEHCAEVGQGGDRVDDEPAPVAMWAEGRIAPGGDAVVGACSLADQLSVSQPTLCELSALSGGLQALDPLELGLDPMSVQGLA